MAKKLGIKFTSANPITPDSINSINDDYADDSSVQLVSITDEDSEEESFSDFNEFQPNNKVDPTMICAMAQDEIDLYDSKVPGKEQPATKNDNKQKKNSINKMDKLMKHLQEALTSSSSSSSSNNDSNRTESKNKENDLQEDVSPNQSATTSSLVGKHPNMTPTTTTTNNSNNSNNSSGISWLNEIKFANFVNLNKLRNEKLQKTSSTMVPAESADDVKKITLASGGGGGCGCAKSRSFSTANTATDNVVANNLVTSPLENVSNESGISGGGGGGYMAGIVPDDQHQHPHHLIEQQSLSDKNNVGKIQKQTSLSFSNLLAAAAAEQDSNLSLITTATVETTNSSMMKEKKLKDIFKPDKELKKKFTLFDKKSDLKSNNLAKLISPTKNSPSPVPPSPSSLASALLSPNTNHPTVSSNSQVFSNFLANFTNSAKTNSNNGNNIGTSRSASTENVNIILDGSATSKSYKSANKLPTSKSMMTFRKVIKNENEINDAVEAVDDLGCFLSANCSTQNPTLRRRTKSAFSSKFSMDITGQKLMESSSTSSSSASLNLLHPLDEASNNRSKRLIKNDSLNNDQLQQQQQQQPSPSQQPLLNASLWNTITSSIQFYYSLIFMACVSLFLLCISPLPSFLNGFVFGFLLAFFMFVISIIYLVANFLLIKSDQPMHRNVMAETVGLKRTRSKRLSVNVPVSNADGSIYAGWVYEFIGDYTEREKNGFVSRLVYVVLSGSKLNIYVPSQEMNEKKLKQQSESNRCLPVFQIASQRMIDLSRPNHKRVVLYLTKNVRNQRKYIWNKKYPICIEYSDNNNNNDCGKEDVDGSNQYLPASSSTPIVSKLVIFARTCREKEEWFWAIKTTIDSTLNYKIPGSNRGSSNSLTDSPSESKTCLSFVVNGNEAQSTDGDTNSTQQYLHILTRRVTYAQFLRTNILNCEGVGPGKPGMMTALTWFNVLLNRLSFDILNKPNWSAYIAKKLQRKLRRLRLPYFMESLSITEIDIGSTLPKFNSVPSAPTVDDAGLWVEFDVSYSGGFTMTLETKINLLKLSSNVENFGDVSPASTPTDSPKLTQKNTGRYWSSYRTKNRGSASPSPGNNTYLNEECCENDSDIDSIVTSSEDEEPETAPAAPDEADADEKQKKLIRFVEKIASSQYFQKASQMNFFKKTLEGISNMSIMLTVQLNSLNGTLAINIPEPPTDRLWYGFRNDPTIQITARPKLGDHDLNLSYVTNFIEKKLRTEFFNYFVLPNMDDFFIPALNTRIEQYINVVP